MRCFGTVAARISSRAEQLHSPHGRTRRGIPGHRLYSRGLAGTRGIGIVRESELISSFQVANRVHPRHDPSRFDSLEHFVVPLKENLVEVVARSLTV